MNETLMPFQLVLVKLPHFSCDCPLLHKNILSTRSIPGTVVDAAECQSQYIRKQEKHHILSGLFCHILTIHQQDNYLRGTDACKNFLSKDFGNTGEGKGRNVRGRDAHTSCIETSGPEGNAFSLQCASPQTTSSSSLDPQGLQSNSSKELNCPETIQRVLKSFHTRPL